MDRMLTNKVEGLFLATASRSMSYQELLAEWSALKPELADSNEISAAVRAKFLYVGYEVQDRLGQYEGAVANYEAYVKEQALLSESIASESLFFLFSYSFANKDWQRAMFYAEKIGSHVASKPAELSRWIDRRKQSLGLHDQREVPEVLIRLLHKNPF